MKNHNHVTIDEKTSDEDLVVYIREKDKEYFCFIVDRYESKIRRYLNKLTGNSSEVDDLLQQTFVNVYVNLNSFDKNKKFSSWVYRIAHNLTMNWLKKRKSYVYIEDNDTIINKIAAETDIAEELASKEVFVQLKDIVNSLPDKFKEPLILKYMENKSYEEISDILRKPKNTIGSMISRAKKILKKELSKTHG